MKTHALRQRKHQLCHNISKHVIFQNKWNCMGPLNDESYKLMQRTTETEKIEKSSKILTKCNVINFKSIHFKLTASSKIVHSILNYKLIRPVSILRLHKM